MLNRIVASIVILCVAVIMSMVGRGGGNFYVPILVAVGLSMHNAAATGQFLLFSTSGASTIVFHKYKNLDLKLVLVIVPPTFIMAFFGGYYSHMFSGVTLKLIFSGLLVLASFLMLRPVKEKKKDLTRRTGYWQRKFGGYRYEVPVWLSIPITAATGFVAGMVGISGGSFLVPLMVLACGVPMRIAVGTSLANVAATAFTGFLGHALRGDFNPEWTLPLAAVAIAGGLVGGNLSLKIKPEKLKLLFTFTTLAAAIFMATNAFLIK